MNPVSNIGGTPGTFQSISLQEKRSCSSSSITSSNKSSRTSSPSGTDSPATTNVAGSKRDTPTSVFSDGGFFVDPNKSSCTLSPSGIDSPATTNEAGTPTNEASIFTSVFSADGNINEGLNGLDLLSDAATGQLGNGIAPDVDSSQNGATNSEYNQAVGQSIPRTFSFDPFAADEDSLLNGAPSSVHNQAVGKPIPRPYSLDLSGNYIENTGISETLDSSQNKKSDVTASDSGSEDGSTSSTKFVLKYSDKI